MSNAIASLRTDAISTAVTPVVTEAEAKKALKLAGLSNAIRLDKVDAQKKVGQFVGHDYFGVIMTDNIQYRQMLMRLARRLEKLTASNDPEVQKMASQQLNEIVKTVVKLSEVEMKCGEVVSLRSQSISIRGRQPASPHEPNTQIHSKATVVIVGGKPPGIETTPSTS